MHFGSELFNKETLFKILEENSLADVHSVESLEIKHLVNNSKLTLSEIGRLTINTQDPQAYIIKTIPTSHARALRIRSTGLFAKEAKLYAGLFPKINNLLQQKPPHFSIPRYPEPLFVNDTQDKEILIIEDLCRHGFKNGFVTTTGFSLDCCRAVLKWLATFHAATYIFFQSSCKDNGPVLEHYPFLSDRVFVKPLPGLKKSIVSKYDSLKKMLDIIQPPGSNFGDRFQKYGLNQTFAERERSILEPTEGFNTLCHGDPWSKNMLFSFERTKQECSNILDTALFDFQFARYASPATDLVYFIYSSTTSEVRSSHLKELLFFYHECLCEYLDAYKMASNNYNTAHLINDFKRCQFWGFIFALQALPVQFDIAPRALDSETRVKMSEQQARQWSEQEEKQRFMQILESPDLLRQIRDLLDEMRETLVV